MTASGWIALPGQQAQQIGDKTLRGMKISIIIAGIIALAIFVMILTIWMVYWIRKRKCQQIAKDVGRCVTMVYLHATSHTAFGLTGVVMAAVVVIFSYLIKMRNSAERSLKNLNDAITTYEEKLQSYYNRAQIVASRLGFNLNDDSQGIQLNSALTALEQGLTPEVSEELKKTVDMVKASLKAAGIGQEKTDALTMIKQAQRILQFASPATIETTQDAVRSLTATWGQLTSDQRQRTLALFQKLSGSGSAKAAGSPYVTTDEFEKYIKTITKMYNWIEYLASKISKAQTYYQWITGKCSGQSAQCSIVTSQDKQVMNDNVPDLADIPWSDDSYPPLTST